MKNRKLLTVLLLIFAFCLTALASCVDMNEAPETESGRESDTEPDAAPESFTVVKPGFKKPEKETEKETEKKTEKETDKETDAEDETAAAADGTTAQDQTAPAQPGEVTQTEDVDLSGNVSGGTGSPGSSGGGSSGSSGPSGGSQGPSTTYPGEGHGLNTVTGGRIHCYADAPSLEYEDTSNTLSYMPMRQEGATDPGGIYNKRQILESNIYPGYLAQGDQPYSTTLIGYDGFLFCADTFGDYDGTSLYTAGRFDNLVNSMAARNNWVESQGKKMYIVFIPNKNSVYDDYMPEGYPMGSYRRIDQVVDALRAKGIKVVDGRDSLIAAKNSNPARALYYKTDTHWNNHGGFEVYLQLMNEIKKDFPNVVVHTRQDYQINYCETYMKDQCWYLGYYDETHEIGPVYTLKSGNTARFVTSRQKDVWGQFAFCYRWPSGYSDHLYYYVWQNDYNRDAPSMYMLRDSYSVALNGFLKDSFYKSTYDWSFAFSRSAITSSGADVIIIEAVEKNIQTMFAQAMFAD